MELLKYEMRGRVYKYLEVGGRRLDYLDGVVLSVESSKIVSKVELKRSEDRRERTEMAKDSNAITPWRNAL